ncbi:protein kinase [Dermatophilaceae bacterium Sec6.4]
MNVGKGDTLGGRYRLDDRIAAGGMGVVWTATDAILGRTVAVKVLTGGLTDDIGFEHRFRTEARLAAALTHANIAAVHDYGEDEGSAYLVMEYVPGLPLSRIIADRSPMPAADTVGLISQTATALQTAHRSGLVHRDVKPANVLVTPDGIVKLTDFGIARAVGSAAMTKTGEVMGTAQYLAPEAALGLETTPLSDVYALGVVTYEMLCGFRPFVADSPVALAMAHVNELPPPMPDFVPPPVRAVVLAALEKDPNLRPDSAAEFGRALRQAIDDSARMGFDPYREPPRHPSAAGGRRVPPPAATPTPTRTARATAVPRTAVHHREQATGSSSADPNGGRGRSRRFMLLAVVALVIVIGVVVAIVLTQGSSPSQPTENFTKPIQIVTLGHPGASPKEFR